MMSTNYMKVLLKKTATLCTAVFLISTISCNQPDREIAILNVHLDRASPNLKVLFYDTSTIKAIDSVNKSSKNLYKFKITITEAGIYALQAGDHKTEFLAKPDDTVNVRLTTSGDYLTGNKENVNFRLFIDSLDSYDQKADSLVRLFMQSQATDSFALVRERTAGEFNRLVSLAKGTSTAYIKNNPTSIGIVRAINSSLEQIPFFNHIIDLPMFELVDSLLLLNHPTNSNTAWMHRRVVAYTEKARKNSLSLLSLKAGKSFPGINLPGIDGRPLKLDPSSNEVTLVYLWDEGTESRKATNLIKRELEKYQVHGLGVHAIAFIEDPRSWSSIVVLDKMWFNNVNDSLAHGSELLKTMGVNSLPVIVIVDSQGKILQAFNNTLSLSEWLNEYFVTNGTEKSLN